MLCHKLGRIYMKKLGKQKHTRIQVESIAM